MSLAVRCASDTSMFSASQRVSGHSHMVSPTFDIFGSLFMNSSDDVGLVRPSQSGMCPASGDTLTGGGGETDDDDLGLSRVDMPSRIFVVDDDVLLGGGWGENAVVVAAAPSVSTRAAARTFIVIAGEG